jgi:hypothetical protein
MNDLIKNRLVAEGRRLFDAKPGIVEFTKDTATDRLMNDLEEHPHAFVIACIMDRQVRRKKGTGYFFACFLTRIGDRSHACPMSARKPP